jgi:hypothetical protein
MISNSNVKLTIAFNDPDLDIEAQNEIEQSNRIINPNLSNSNVLGGFAVEMFTFGINPANIKIDGVFQITEAIAYRKASQLDMRSRKFLKSISSM